MHDSMPVTCPMSALEEFLNLAFTLFPSKRLAKSTAAKLERTTLWSAIKTSSPATV
jgi:hypothetical protein